MESKQEQLSIAFPEERRRVASARKDDPMRTRCTGCGKAIAVPQWLFEEGLRLHFCSEVCRKTWTSEHDLDGDGLIQLDGRPDYRGGNWQLQAQRARERDHYTCRICKITEEALGKQLDVHHIIPFKLFKSPVEANKLSNLLSVCRSCHMKLEAEGNASLPLFLRSQGNSTAETRSSQITPRRGKVNFQSSKELLDDR